MESATGEKVDLYIPRKCSWTNRLITAKDHASVQIKVANIDATTGKYEGDYQVYALCGFIRGKGEADLALTELVRKADGN